MLRLQNSLHSIEMEKSHTELTGLATLEAGAFFQVNSRINNEMWAELSKIKQN